MINHYYTLCQVASDLQKKLINCKIIECFTQEKDELIIVFYNESEIYNLCINLSANEQTIYLKDTFARARSNSRDIFPEILSKSLNKIDISNNDRVIFFRLNGRDIAVNLSGASGHNCLILDKEHTVINAFYNVKELKSTQFERKENILPPASRENFNTVSKLLTNSDILLPKIYANELLEEYQLEAKSSIDDNLEQRTTDEILLNARAIRSEALASRKYYLYIYPDNSAVFSLLPLLSSDAPKPLIFEDVHKAIARRTSYQKKSEATQISKASILKKLNTIKSKLEKNIAICENTNDLLQIAEKYNTYADILISSPKPNQKAGKALKTYDWQGQEISIPLDEKLNLIDNSEKYYKKNKKIKADIEKREEMLPKYQKKYSQITELIEKINQLNLPKEIKKFMNENIKSDKSMNKAINPGEATKYREFDLGSGYILFVGRNASNNDELTMKFAKANDIWMHARGSSGSHAVLRGSDAKETKPPKDILKLAAGITAYYSKQKNAKLVPVAYTYKKYVHKPKGAKPGAVVMQREEVIMAEPKVPEGEPTL